MDTSERYPKMVDEKSALTHENLRDRSELAASLIPRNVWEGCLAISERTTDGLGDMWMENIVANLESSYFEKQMRADELKGIGTNKAVIGVGAGPSFKKNEDVLKELSDMCVSLHLDVQPFVIIASNHMYKPLLEKGIYPHFVMLIDGGDAVYDQLCKDVPKNDRTILLAPLQIHPSIAENWVKQGRSIVWCNSLDENKMEVYRKHTGDDPKKVGLEFGGNVLNCMWAAGLRFFRSNVFMAVGNDLCFPRKDSLKQRRKEYYATGNYEVNIKNLRDEARSTFAWMGFDLKESGILSNNGESIGTYADFEVVNMSHTLFTYKMWAESQIIMNAEIPGEWHYFNCSEAGTLGVMSRSETKEEMATKDNWYLLDHNPIVGKRYHTAKLDKAALRWIQWREQKARKRLRGILTDAKSAGILHP
ncbi:MAG: 6-hydroxymethylpterin diphosphokinase MptE-like protein [Candidatus Thorarchaeota archaeon]|jgi:hypothetical protein